jgi:hypothetical protein
VDTFLTDVVVTGTGPTIIYGTPALVPLNTLTIQSGAIKDYTSGVMGTGRGRISGTVKEKGVPSAPVYRKVRLFRDSDGLLMRELWSHPTTGAYSFEYIDELQKFTVISYDHLRNYRAVIADNLIPELMP